MVERDCPSVWSYVENTKRVDINSRLGRIIMCNMLHTECLDSNVMWSFKGVEVESDCRCGLLRVGAECVV